MPGNNSTERPCPRCQGRGLCVDCGGTGRVGCPGCQGQGRKVSPRGLESDCRVCAGSGHIACPVECPSCAGTGRITDRFQREIQQKYTVSFTNYSPVSHAVTVLVALSVAAYLVAPPDFTPLLPQPLPMVFWSTMKNHAYVLETLQLWRFLTPVLLHGGWWHLLANMSFLVSLGPGLEGVLGTRRFLVLYLLSAVGGNLLSWAFNPVPGVGASTALFGVGAAYVGLYLRWRLFDQATARRIGTTLVGILVLGFAAQGFMGFFLDNWGHLGGGLVGLALTWFGPRPRGH